MTGHLRRTLLYSAVLLAALLMTGCKEAPQRSAPSSDPAGHTPPTTVGGFDATAMREALQGRWDVQQGTRDLFYFEFKGDKARVVDVRFAAPRFIDGTLSVRSATGFGITDTDGVTSFYSAVLTDEDAFIGLGAAIELSPGDTFEAKLSAWERLTLDETGGCTYTKKWGESVNQREVACEFKKKGGRDIFTYQADDQFRPDRLKRYEWIRVGGYLMNRELADAEAHRLAEGETSAVDPGTSPGPGQAYGALGKPVPGGPETQGRSEKVDTPTPRPDEDDRAQAKTPEPSNAPDALTGGGENKEPTKGSSPP